MSPSIPSTSDSGSGRGVLNSKFPTVVEVWADDLDSAFSLINTLPDTHPLIAMDTEFPGVAVRRADVMAAGPTSPPLAPSDLNYQNLRANVDLLHLIQLGLAFSDPGGAYPTITFQFNFREFNPETDPCDPTSLTLLSNAGVDLSAHRARGADVSRFAELLTTSGCVLNPDVSWVTFHGGYDVGYLLKALTGRKLPETLTGFVSLMNVFFPKMYDLKHCVRFCNVPLWGGLESVGKGLAVERVGVCHQAGSDALLTLRSFEVVVERFLRWGMVERYAGVLYGMSEDYNTMPKQ